MNFLSEEQPARKESERWVDPESAPTTSAGATWGALLSEALSKYGVDFGGRGMIPESDMERYFREGMQPTVAGGTSQIKRTIVAQEMRL